MSLAHCSKLSRIDAAVQAAVNPARTALLRPSALDSLFPRLDAGQRMLERPPNSQQRQKRHAPNHAALRDGRAQGGRWREQNQRPVLWKRKHDQARRSSAGGDAQHNALQLGVQGVEHAGKYGEAASAAQEHGNRVAEEDGKGAIPG